MYRQRIVQLLLLAALMLGEGTCHNTNRPMAKDPATLQAEKGH